MKRFLTLLAVIATCLMLLAPTVAEAKRLGGGGSFGKQRAVPTQRQAQKAPSAAPEKAPASAPAGNKWLGPLAGLAIGAGLASMFAGGGLGGSMGTILLALLAAGVVVFLVSRFSQSRASAQPAMQYAGARPYTEPPQPMMSGGGIPAPSVGNIPADFPAEAFLRNGKASFIRLQAANDRKDLDDIREYTTPEMFAEIAMQTQERGDELQKTDVSGLEAELLEVATEGHYTIASVLFTGQLRENNGAPEAVNEVWHVQKDLRDDKSVWLLAGIQQVQ